MSAGPGNALRELREFAGLTIEETATLAGTSPKYLGLVESGEMQSTMAFAAQVTKALADWVHATAVEALISDLQWQDVPIDRVRACHAMGVAVGDEIHLLSLHDERSGTTSPSVHAIGSCPDLWCRAVGETQRTRHRPGRRTLVTFYGVRTVQAVDAAGDLIAIDPTALKRKPA